MLDVPRRRGEHSRAAIVNVCTDADPTVAQSVVTRAEFKHWSRERERLSGRTPLAELGKGDTLRIVAEREVGRIWHDGYGRQHSLSVAVHG